MSLYSKLEKKNDPINYYKNTLQTFFCKIVELFPEWGNPVMLPKDILDSTPLIILITSTKGFCGGFNADLTKFFKRTFFKEEHQVPNFITVGQKATNFIKEENLGKTFYSFNTLNSNNYLNITNELIDIIINKDNNFSSISVYSNFFRNFFIQKPNKTIITPLDLSQTSTDEAKILDRDDFIWENNPKEAARFLAMDNATNNAEKILEQITRKYNKLRQASITKELLELSASFT